MFNIRRTNFNSIKVQLEHIYRKGLDMDNLDFNSIKVQLELPMKNTSLFVSFISIP